jgi:hypothetical protein
LRTGGSDGSASRRGRDRHVQRRRHGLTLGGGSGTAQMARLRRLRSAVIARTAAMRSP